MRERVIEVAKQFAEMIENDTFTQEEFYSLYTTIYQTLRRHSTFGGSDDSTKEEKVSS